MHISIATVENREHNIRVTFTPIGGGIVWIDRFHKGQRVSRKRETAKDAREHLLSLRDLGFEIVGKVG